MKRTVSRPYDPERDSYYADYKLEWNWHTGYLLLIMIMPFIQFNIIEGMTEKTLNNLMYTQHFVLFDGLTSMIFSMLSAIVSGIDMLIIIPTIVCFIINGYRLGFFTYRIIGPLNFVYLIMTLTILIRM